MSASAVFHPKAWLCWLLAAASVTLSIQNPAVTATALVALGVVAARFARGGPEGRSFSVFLKLGLIFCGVRVVLFALTGHTGDTTLFRLPEFTTFGWLGALTIGGRVTGEVLAQSIAEGLRIVAFLATFGVFLSIVEPSRLVRMLPRRLHDAGLVLGIAITFVPVMLRTAADVRDAQRLRGHRFRGARAIRPLVMPVIASSLERSLDLAASMESRGYGGARPRTRLRAEALASTDRALIAISLAVAVAAFVARALPGAQWYPYPTLAWPSLDARLVALAAVLVAPVVVAAIHAARVRRSDDATPPRAALPEEVAA